MCSKKIKSLKTRWYLKSDFSIIYYIALLLLLLLLVVVVLVGVRVVLWRIYLFILYVTTLSVSRIIHPRIERCLVNNEEKDLTTQLVVA
jgi:hypothetical protein